MKEQLYSASRLASIAKLDRRAVERKLQGIPFKTEGKARFYTLTDALPALCREPADAEGEARLKALRERQQAAETQHSELALLPGAEKLCLLSDAKLFWSDGFIAIRQAIQGAPFLNDSQKAKTLARLVAAKPAKMPQPTKL